MAEPVGVYIHIPFCRRRCHYCAFNSYALGDGVVVDDYLTALAAEMAAAAADGPLAARTLYIGGGTPTCLSARQLERLLANCRKYLALPDKSEFTVEANPGTLDEAKLAVLKDYGINRLSLGLQAVQDSLLRQIGRIHTYGDFLAAYEMVRESGFANVNIDLIFALPGQTPADWMATLAAAVHLRPEHISAYSLILEPGTPLHLWWQRGLLDLPDEEAETEMFATTLRELPRAGYEHYEISNYARPGRRSEHNQIYWRNEEYWGFGAGAHSYRGRYRRYNLSRPEAYIAAVAAGCSPVDGREKLTPEIAMAETIMLGLRCREGVDLRRFAGCFGVDPRTVYSEQIAKLAAEGLIEQTAERLRLTERGLWLANLACREFLPD
ncbi:MAG: radical SAM family heme chaperone HemW [bacterium]